MSGRVDALIDRHGPEVAGMLAAFELYAAGGTFATTPDPQLAGWSS